METVAAAYTPTMTYNTDPEDAIANLRGVACILDVMATADATMFRNIGDAYGVLGEVIKAATDRLGKSISEHE